MRSKYANELQLIDVHVLQLIHDNVLRLLLRRKVISVNKIDNDLPQVVCTNTEE